jgi:hypothetical protein
MLIKTNNSFFIRKRSLNYKLISKKKPNKNIKPMLLMNGPKVSKRTKRPKRLKGAKRLSIIKIIKFKKLFGKRVLIRFSAVVKTKRKNKLNVKIHLSIFSLRNSQGFKNKSLLIGRAISVRPKNFSFKWVKSSINNYNKIQINCDYVALLYRPIILQSYSLNKDQNIKLTYKSILQNLEA